MPQQPRQSRQGRAFHFEIGKTVPLVLEPFDLPVQFRIGRPEAQVAPLGSIKSRGRDRHAFDGRVGKKFCQFFRTSDEIGRCQQASPSRVFHESLFDFQFADFIAAVVIIQESVETDRNTGKNQIPDPKIGRDRTAGAQTHQRQRSLLLLHGTRPEVDIEQRVDFVDDDVDIIGTDPGRNDAHPFAFIGPGDGRELPVGRFGLNPLEMGRNLAHTARVAHQDDGRRQLARTQV